MEGQKNSWRETIHRIINKSDNPHKLKKPYNIFLFIIIIVSVIPIFYQDKFGVVYFLDHFSAYFFLVDYILRFITADYAIGKGKKSFLIYPFTFWSIINLLSIVAAFHFLPSQFILFRLIELFREFWIIKLFI